MQATYECKGKLFIEEGCKDLGEMNGDIFDDIVFIHGEAPTPDKPGAWNLSIAQRVDMAVLEQVCCIMFINILDEIILSCFRLRLWRTK